MEAPSSQTHRGSRRWQGLLLAVSLSTFWIPPITAKPTVESAPLHAAEGQDVLLLVRSVTRDPLLYQWYKGTTTDSSQRIITYIVHSQANTTGPAHRGRETIYTNGSLLIQKVTQNDAGSYTFAVIYTNGFMEEANGQLHVHLVLPKPRIIRFTKYSHTVELTCEPETQDTTYLWSVNHQSLPDSPRLQLSKGNRTLTIHNVIMNDTGSYVCETQNPVSASRSDPFKLIIFYGPAPPIISPSHAYYHSGEVLRLYCHADSNPPAQYSWLINGIPQQYTQELVIPKVTESDSGSYICLAHNSVTGFNSTAVRNIKVFAVLPIPYITSKNPNPVENKDTVELTCEPETLDTTYLWSINSQSLPDSPRLQLSKDNRTLTILHVTRKDTGPYVCNTQNPVSANRSDPFILNVLYGPDPLTIFPSHTYYHSGDILRLSCHTDSNPPAQYSWLINGTSQSYTQELIIPIITERDSGSYTCLANNSHTGYNRTAVRNIKVFAVLPKPHITSDNSNPMEHVDTIKLTCEPETQDTTYLWSINSQSLPDSPRLQLSEDNRTLTLLHVTRNDIRSYVCDTRNPVSARRSDPFILNVLYGPDMLTISPSQTYYHPGANLSLSCHTASNPPAQYSWLINGMPKQNTHKLVIPKISESDSGSYTCLAHNSVTGLYRTTIKVIIVSGEDTTGLSAGAVTVIVLGVLVEISLAASLGCYLIHRISGRVSNKRGLTEHQPPVSTPDSAPTGTSNTLAPNLIPNQLFPTIYHELQHPDADNNCQINLMAEVVF